MKFFSGFFIAKINFTQKISELERKINQLELTLSKLQMTTEPPMKDVNEKKKEISPNINIEQLHVDKIIIEHLDYANNFGHLGIKDLSGRLNIGTSYEGDISKLIEEKVAEKLEGKAKVNLRAKKEE